MEEKEKYQHFTSYDLSWTFRDMGPQRLKEMFDRITLVEMRRDIISQFRYFHVDNVGAEWLETRILACKESGDDLQIDLAQYYLLGPRNERDRVDMGRAFRFVVETFMPRLKGKHSWSNENSQRIMQSVVWVVQRNSKMYWVAADLLGDIIKVILTNLFDTSKREVRSYGRDEWFMFEAAVELLVIARDTSLLPYIKDLTWKHKFPQTLGVFALEGARPKAHETFFASAVQFLSSFWTEYGLDEKGWKALSEGIIINVNNNCPYNHQLLVNLKKLPWMVGGAVWQARYEVEGDQKHHGNCLLIDGGEQGFGSAVFETYSYRFRIWFDLHNGKEPKKFYVDFVGGRPYFND